MFLDELLPDFYERIGDEYRHARVEGQICRTPIVYTHEHKEIWRPDRYDGTQTRAELFRITASGGDAYNRQYPLADPKLGRNEEFPVLRAKLRPVVVVRPQPQQVPMQPLPGGPRLTWPIVMVAPCYSVEDQLGNAKFPNEYLDRVRCLEYPEVFFLPERPAALNKDSLLALYRMTGIFHAHLEATPWKLSNQILRVLQGQMRFYLTGEYSGDYSNAREMLLNPT
jgi:hypothetical protein